MQDYTPNSHKYKAEQAAKQAERKKAEKIVDGVVKTKKKGEARKFADLFVSEDASNVKSYILMEVVVPLVKDAIFSTVETILYGESKRAGKRTSASDRVSYVSYYDRKDSRSATTRTRTAYDFDDIILASRGEAEDVLTSLDEIIGTYGHATVSDLYDLVGLTCNYTDTKYGWMSVSRADVVRTRDGYMLKMPKAMVID